MTEKVLVSYTMKILTWLKQLEVETHLERAQKLPDILRDFRATHEIWKARKVCYVTT